MKFFLSILLTILILILVTGFYWFGYRPEQIRKDCYVYAEGKAEKQIKSLFGSSAYKIASELGGESILEEQLGPIYNSCLREKGIVLT